MPLYSKDMPASNEPDRSPVRIQVLLNSFVLDGPGRLVLSLAEQWRKCEGVQVRVAALTRGGILKKMLGELDVPAELIEAQGLTIPSRARRWAAETGRNWRPDILHTHLARPDLIGPFLARRLGHPRIVSTNHGLHAWWQKGRTVGVVYGMLYRMRQKKLDRIVAVSRSVAEDLERAGIDSRRVCVIPNGVDPEVFRPASGAQKREFRALLGLDEMAQGPLILLVGNLIPLKGHEHFIRALPGILQQVPTARALIVGQGPLEASLLELATELRVSHAIKRLSPLSMLLPKVMGAADLLVHPSLTESFGLVVAEAQACGLPVVAARVGGPAEILVDGETGLLVPVGNPQAIAESVCTLVANTEVMRTMGLAGRQRVLQLFDIRRCASDYLTLFRSLTPSPRGRKSDASEAVG